MTDVERVGPVATAWRGLRRRCGRCGSRGILDGWFRLREHCPTCGYRFKREEGFFTGVILVNFMFTLGVLWVLLMGFVLWRAAADESGTVVPSLVAGMVLAVVLPIVFYPVAATTWAALDLVMRPLEPEEEAEAATWAELPTEDPQE
jgi:uncharacterized protein (DUF983 family)